jgi:hypothetical protein
LAEEEMTGETMESDVLLARSGDAAAFHRLVDRCSRTVCSIAFAIVRNVHASEDVAQEVFLAAWENLGNLRNPASFLPWLRQVAALLGISEAAARQRLSRSRALIRDEMLERFGSAVAASAPGASFTSAVAVLLPAAPAVSAGIAAKASASAGAVSIAKGTLLGALLGWAGVLLGMRSLEPAFDERERRQLRRFRNVVLIVVTLGCAAVAASVSSALRLLIALQSSYVVVAALYVVWLPRILRRRFDALHADDPAQARAFRRRWLRSMIVPAVAAALAGVMLMAVVLTLRG